MFFFCYYVFYSFRVLGAGPTWALSKSPDHFLNKNLVQKMPRAFRDGAQAHSIPAHGDTDNCGKIEIFMKDGVCNMNELKGSDRSGFRSQNHEEQGL